MHKNELNLSPFYVRILTFNCSFPTTCPCATPPSAPSNTVFQFEMMGKGTPLRIFRMLCQYLCLRVAFLVGLREHFYRQVSISLSFSNLTHLVYSAHSPLRLPENHPDSPQNPPKPAQIPYHLGQFYHQRFYSYGISAHFSPSLS